MSWSLSFAHLLDLYFAGESESALSASSRALGLARTRREQALVLDYRSMILRDMGDDVAALDAAISSLRLQLRHGASAVNVAETSELVATILDELGRQRTARHYWLRAQRNYGVAHDWPAAVRSGLAAAKQLGDRGDQRAGALLAETVQQARAAYEWRSLASAMALIESLHLLAEHLHPRDVAAASSLEAEISRLRAEWRTFS